MTWKDLNVFQWQQLNDLFLKSKDVTDLDLAISAASICTGLTNCGLYGYADEKNIIWLESG